MTHEEEKLIKRLYKMASEGESESFGVFGKDDILPLTGKGREDLTEEEQKASLDKGEDIFREGAFAVLTMAGGQGTRLGFNGPKGAYDIGLSDAKSLFEVQAKKIYDAGAKYGAPVRWYIMTSGENNGQTVEFFEKNGYFGLSKENVVFFVQCMLPMVAHDGKIVYDRPGHIKMGADGHGGIFRGVVKTGVIDHMKKNGVKWIYVGGIDNVLANLCDPFFVGYTENMGCRIGAKTLMKRNPDEKVGVFCTVNGRPHVIEYSELPKEEAEKKNQDGKLLFGDAHILCNLFRIDVFEEMADEITGLPYHVADKKVVCTGEDGSVSEFKAYKFELFMFDAFRFFDKIALLRVKREDEFAPVKNKEGEDSPESAKKMYEDWKKRNGI